MGHILSFILKCFFVSIFYTSRLWSNFMMINHMLHTKPPIFFIWLKKYMSSSLINNRLSRSMLVFIIKIVPRRQGRCTCRYELINQTLFHKVESKGNTVILNYWIYVFHLCTWRLVLGFKVTFLTCNFIMVSDTLINYINSMWF